MVQLGYSSLIVGSALLLGGALHQTALLICSFNVALWVLLHRQVRRGWNPISTIFLALSVWSLLSVVPVPLDVLWRISPSTAEIWSRSVRPLGVEPPVWVTLSLDPSATWLEIAKWTAYSAAASISVGATRDRGSCQHALVTVGATAVLVSAATIVHDLVGAQSVFGVYRPRGLAQHVLVGPLVNPNNLASLANLGTFCILALIGARRKQLPAAALITCLLTCIVTTVLSGSRGGVATLVLGLLASGAVWDSRRQQEPSRRILRTGSHIALGFVGGALILLLSAASPLANILFDDDLGKLRSLKRLAPLLDDHGVLGIGRGAFETISDRYLEPGPNIIVQKIENLPVHWAIEWGIPVALVALVALGWLIRPTRLPWSKSRSVRIIWIALAALITQNLVDLGLELVSLGLCASYLLGALEGSRSTLGPTLVREFDKPPGKLRQLYKPIFALGGLLLSMGGTAAAFRAGPGLMELRDSIHEVLMSTTWDNSSHYESFNKTLRQEILKRPSEPYFAMAGAIAALSGHHDALPWAAAALERSPSSGRVHYLAALALRQRGSLEQPLMELKRAITFDPRLTRTAVEQALKWTSDSDSLQRLVPDGPKGGPVLLVLVEHLPSGLPDPRIRLLNQAISRDPKSLQAHTMMAFVLLTELYEQKRLCDKEPEARNRICNVHWREDKLVRIDKLLKNIDLLGRDTCEGTRVRMRLAIARETSPDQVSEIANSCANCNGPLPCYRDALSLLRGHQGLNTLRSLEDRYLSVACGDEASCIAAESWIAEGAADRGAWARAYLLRVRVAGRTHSGEAWLKAAEAATRAQGWAQAKAAIEKATALGADATAVRTELHNARASHLSP